MEDAQFLEAFETLKLQHHQFPHRAHVRMAWLYLRRDPWEQALHNIRDGIKRFTTAHGAPSRYHETTTVFWAKIIDDAIKRNPEIADFRVFARQNPHLMDSELIDEYYSSHLLYSADARDNWVEPDLKSLPISGESE